MAAKQKLLNFFDLETAFAGGGSFFNAGRYKIVASFFSMFDFQGKADDAVPALSQELQPLNSKGKDEGDPIMQYWPIRGKGIELVNPIKGKKGAFASLEMTGDYDTAMKSGEFFEYMQALRKAEFDMDQHDNDITVLDDLDVEMNTMVDPYDAKKKASADDDDDKEKKKYGPKLIPIVTALTKGGKAAGKATGKKAKEEEEEEEDEKPAKKGGKDKEKGGKKGGKKKDASDMEAEEILALYLTDVLVPAEEATTRPMLRVALGKYITGELELEAEMSREVQALVNDDDVLSAQLEKVGWELDGKTIQPE